MAQPEWLSALKTEFKNNLLVPNVVVGMILTRLEELAETAFACPCEPEWNAVFVFPFFIVPASLVFLVMIYTQGCVWKRENLHASFVPSLTWIILLFMDGQYFACAMTSWPGRFVAVDEGDLQKWCKPTNHTSPEDLRRLKIKTQLWFTLSQGIGIALISLLTVAFGVRCKWGKEEEQEGNYSSDRESNQNAEASL